MPKRMFRTNINSWKSELTWLLLETITTTFKFTFSAKLAKIYIFQYNFDFLLTLSCQFKEDNVFIICMVFTQCSTY